MIRLSNDFHKTQAACRPGRLSRATVLRLRRELCGGNDCLCGGYLGERGRQPSRYTYEPTPDRGAQLIELSDDGGAY